MSTSQSLPAWKEEVAAKLTEHRSRRKLSPELQGRLAELEPSFSSAQRQPAASRIAARVAERYSKAPSYREMLEQEAAQAPARLVTRAAEAPAQHAAQPDPEPSLFEASPAPAAESIAEPAAAEPRARVTRWAEFEPSPVPEFFSGPVAAPQEAEIAPEITAQPHPSPIPPAPEAYAIAPTLFAEPEPIVEAPVEPEPEEDPTLSLLAELASQPLEPTQPLPARIIEFPRELVAPRKARPRQERGPEYETEEQLSQLRIFEAEPAAAATVTAPEQQPQTTPDVDPTPAVKTQIAPPPSAPDRNAIRLDEEPATAPASFLDAIEVAPEASSLLLDPPIYTANLEDRLMAGIVDICLVGAGFLMFVAAFAACTPHIPTGKIALIGASGALLALFVVYQYLFLNFGEATPGMRYAKIALCTFDDENPTRQAMRSRIGFLLLSALPLGLGFLWSLFDEERLGWHDRITRTYQRSYREE
ncbi:MAG: RDD family protein [Acidobacteriaceae bacterium]